MSYRPTLAGRALAQFNDLKDDQVIYDALMERIVRLADEPWDAWPVYPGGEEPESVRLSSARTVCCPSAWTRTPKS